MKIKSLISILSAAVLAAALVGCSANPTASPVPAVNQNSPVTTDDATPAPSAATDDAATDDSATAPVTSPTSDASTAAGDIGSDKALELALADAGVSSADLVNQRVEQDRDDGRTVYEVDFSDATYSYEYKIAAEDGSILELDIDMKNSVLQQSTGTAVTKEEAFALALAKVPGATEQNGYVEEDRDDGRTTFEGSILLDGVEYEFEVDQATGLLTNWSVDYVR